MSSFDDTLARALRAAKAIPKSARPRSKPNSERQRSQSPTPNDKRKRSRHNNNNKICSFCGIEPAAVLISKTLAKNQTPLCLVHYYTTRSCRIDPQKVTILDQSEVNNQLPYVQDLFSEAFSDLQKGISVEAARSFNEMAQRASDPLSILNDHASSSSSNNSSRRYTNLRPTKGNKKDNKDGGTNDGGFMKHVQSREIDLMRQQQILIENENGFITTGSTTTNTSIHGATRQKVNPCKRRKKASKPTWNLILDQEANGLEPQKNIMDFLNPPPHTLGVSCSCGSQKVEMFGNITGRNNDVPKAETWGTKRENEVSTRYQCQSCGKIWNEEE